MLTASSTTERRSTFSPSRRWARAGVWLVVGSAAFGCGKTESEGDPSLNSGGVPGGPEHEATAGSGAQGGEAGAVPADGGEAQGGAQNGGAVNGGEAGASGERVWTEGRAACGDLECDANLTQSGYSNCCYADASNRGCGTDIANGCTSFPATQLHCDSGGDCGDEGFEGQAFCVLSIINRLALCGGGLDPEDDVQLCEPGESCAFGSCQPTTLDGLLPPEYWVCLP